MQKQKLAMAVSAALMLSSFNFTASAAIQDDFATPATVQAGAGMEIVYDESAEDSKIILVAELAELNKESASYLPLNFMPLLTPEHIAVIPPAAMAGFSAAHLQRLSLEAVAALSVEQVSEIQAVALAGFSTEQIGQLSLAAVSVLTAQQLAYLSEEAVGGFTVAQVKVLSVSALAGLTIYNMGGLSDEVIASLGLTLLSKLDIQTFLKLEPGKIVWFLVNLDAATVKPEQLLAYLPAGWSIHPVTGKLKIPKGKLKLKKHKHKIMLPVGLTLPVLLDFNSSLSLGGGASGEGSILAEIKQALMALGFSGFDVTLTDEGILKVSGSGIELNFIADMDEIEQTGDDEDDDDEGGTPEISLDENQNYKLITASGLKITLLTAPKNPVQLLSLIPGGKIKFDKKGNVKLTLPALGKSLIGTFDPLIVAAPVGAQPGISLTGTPGLDEKALVVYTDGTMQVLYPSVTDTAGAFWSAQFYGTGKLKFKANGQMKYLGPDNMLWAVVPGFDIFPIVLTPPLQPYYVWMSKPYKMLYINQEGEGQFLYWKPLGIVNPSVF